jgi:hypothetical protein
MLAFTCCINPVFAKDEVKTENVPSMEFLEYLAELQQVDGKWLSPADMLSLKQATKNSESNKVMLHKTVGLVEQSANESTLDKNDTSKIKPTNNKHTEKEPVK